MSSLDDLSRKAQRFHLKRNRSISPSGSETGSESSSGYGSILSQDEVEQKKINDDIGNTSQESSNQQRHYHSNNINNSNNASEPKDLKLDVNNKGMKLLLKMGWVQGNGLGVSQNGRREPIPTPAQTPLLGLGKATQDAYMLSNAISKPKELESLIIAREDQEAKIKREEKVKEIQTRVVEREDRLKTFHCHTCDKGYTTISQFEEHERSYAHHHAKRALEAKEARKVTGRSTEAKLEKERKREAKELERMARAAGMSLDTSRSSISISTTPKPDVIKSISGVDAFKKSSSGWTKLTPSTSTTTTKLETATSTEKTCNQEPLNSNTSFQNQQSNNSNAISSNKFKSSGFTRIGTSSSSSVGPCNSIKSIDRSIKTNESEDVMKAAPKFVPSSIHEKSAPPSNPNPTTTSTTSTLEIKPPLPSNTAPTQSKFAQIAARLAARKNANLHPPPPSTTTTTTMSTATTKTTYNNDGYDGNGQNVNKKNHCTSNQYNSEIEKMLDL